MGFKARSEYQKALDKQAAEKAKEELKRREMEEKEKLKEMAKRTNLDVLN